MTKKKTTAPQRAGTDRAMRVEAVIRNLDWLHEHEPARFTEVARTIGRILAAEEK